MSNASEYISTIAAELAHLAIGDGQKFLGYLLDMAANEALGAELSLLSGEAEVNSTVG